MHGFRGCSFWDCTVQGVSMNAGVEPVVIGDPAYGNVAWPNDWTVEQAAAWRKEHGMPGPEWNDDPAEHAVTAGGPRPDRASAGEVDTVYDVRSRATPLWREHGGYFFGPNVEHACIEEEKFWPFLHAFALQEREAARAAFVTEFAAISADEVEKRAGELAGSQSQFGVGHNEIVAFAMGERASAYLQGFERALDAAAKVADARAECSRQSAKIWEGARIEQAICEAREEQAVRISAAIKSLRP